jgi:hypothetical protein
MQPSRLERHVSRLREQLYLLCFGACRMPLDLLVWELPTGAFAAREMNL